MDPNIVDSVVAWLAGEFARYFIASLPWILCAGAGTVLGALVFGRNYKRRIGTLERKAREESRSQTFNVAGNLITINGNPVARFSQKFEMLDTVIPLSSGQILTFFVPSVSVEYLDGSSDAVKLPRAAFDEIVTAMEERFKRNPGAFEGWEPLSVKPDALREMLKQHEGES